MSKIIHERPGVFSAYDAVSTTSGIHAGMTIGVASTAAKGTDLELVTLTGYNGGVAAFGGDTTGCHMDMLLRLLFAGGAATVVAVKVADTATIEDYTAAFAKLNERDDVQLVVCDSGETVVHQALREAVEKASNARKERIGVVGGQEENTMELIAHAQALNSERMVLVAPDAVGSDESNLPGYAAAAAVAAVVARNSDPAAPINGLVLPGLCGLTKEYDDNTIDLLVRGGVLPLECVAGEVSPIRGITTRTMTGNVRDATWRELTTILIVDRIIPQLRRTLRRKFIRTKNTAQNRSAIRSQVIVELERAKRAELIESYDGVTAAPSEDDPSVCEVEFQFAVAHGLNQIYLTAHIAV